MRLTLFAIIMNCGYHTQVAAQMSTDKEALFRKYVSQFSVLHVPSTLKYCNTVAEANKLDTSYAIYTNGSGMAYKTFSSGSYICIITLHPADCLIPVFTTYTNSGKKIDEKQLIFGGGSDCGYESRPALYIDNDYGITSVDSVFSYECDSLGNPVPGTVNNHVTYQRAKIRNDGKILVNKPQTQKL